MKLVLCHQTDASLAFVSCDDGVLPDVGDEDVFLKLLFAPINPADINMMEGRYMHQPNCPFVCGNEGVFEVLSCGSAVSDISVGDRVFCPFQGPSFWVGCWQDQLVLDRRYVMRVPDGVSSEQASMLSINPITAYLLLTSFVELTPGDVIVQNLTTSGVGRWVIFLAGLMGIKTVNFVRESSQVAGLKALGADVVEVMAPGVSKTLAEKGEAKLGFNGVGGQSASEVASCLGAKGTLVTYGAMSKEALKFGNASFIYKRLVSTGFNRTHWIEETAMENVIQVFKELFSLIDGRFCEVPVDRVFSLSEIDKAVRYQVSGQRAGKVLLRAG